MHCFVSLSIVRFVFSRIARLNNICLTDLLVASKINSVQSSWYFIFCMRRCCENRVLCSEASDQTHVRDARCCVLFITPGTLHENEGAEVPGDKLHNQSEASANLIWQPTGQWEIWPVERRTNQKALFDNRTQTAASGSSICQLIDQSEAGIWRSFPPFALFWPSAFEESVFRFRSLFLFASVQCGLTSHHFPSFQLFLRKKWLRWLHQN